MEVTSHAPGEPCWAELETSDAGGAKAFYTKLLGLEYQDNPMGEGMVYTMLLKNGKNVGALYQDTSKGIPPHWTTYIAVANADESAAKAKDLGGTVIAEPFDVMTFGRMAVISDPTGAAFCVWQAKDHIGTQVVDEPGATCWYELSTNDTAKAGEFYKNLFGYGTQFHPEMNYTVFKVGDKRVAGMMAITPQMGPMPPNWGVYFNVANTNETAAAATDAGAKVCVPPTDIPDVGRFAVFMDPQGAAFSVLAGPG
jgi:predicted enzyme related to lactoylglutathione lyase